MKEEETKTKSRRKAKMETGATQGEMFRSSARRRPCGKSYWAQRASGPSSCETNERESVERRQTCQVRRNALDPDRARRVGSERERGEAT